MTPDPEKQARLQAWIAEKIVRRHCPSCEHAVDWHAAEMLDLNAAPCDEPGGRLRTGGSVDLSPLRQRDTLFCQAPRPG